MTKRFLICTLAAVIAGPGCGLIYKQNIQQGNAIEQEDLEELYEGMNKRQVLFVLGTPSIRDPFNHERWDYVQTFSRRGGQIVQRTVTLEFDEDDLLAEIIGLEDPFADDSIEPSEPSADDRVTVSQVTGTLIWPPFNPDLMPAELRFVPIHRGLDEDEDEDEKAPGTYEPLIIEPEDTGVTEPDINILRDRDEETRKLHEDLDVLDQIPEDDVFSPDIDG